MSGLVESIDEIIENTLTLFEYGQSKDFAKKRFHDRRIKNGKLFVVLRRHTDYLFAPCKFVGYKKNGLEHQRELRVRDGRDTTRRISKLGLPFFDENSEGYDQIDKRFLDYCRQNEITPSKGQRPRRYWLVSVEKQEGRETRNPDEVDPNDLWEGAIRQVFVNGYERNEEAKKRCLDHFGFSCSVCGVALEEVYGPRAEGLIHVHHLVPLFEIGTSYVVDPVKHLRPVCPNCHAVIHRTRETWSIERVQDAMAAAKREKD